MINKLVGMKIDRAKELLEKENIPFEIVNYNDKKMKEFDQTLVLRAVEKDGVISLIATNFLFVPECEA